MKSFFKYLFATILGLFIFSIIWVVIFFGIIGAAMSGSKEVKISDDSVFELKLEGILVERHKNDVISSFASEINSSVSEIALDDIMASIDKATDNDNIKGIYLHIGDFSASVASLQEIYKGLEKFKKTGRFIVAYADSYGNGTYYLSSIADKVYMNPSGTLALTGINISTVFFKDLLSKIGVEVQIFKVGTFKSAVEPFTQTSMSEANRLQLTTFINSIWTEITKTIARNRGISDTEVNLYADSGLFLDDAQTAVQHKLIDSLVYSSDMKEIIEKLVDKDYNTLTINNMKLVARNKEYSKNRIAIVYAVGEIDGSNKNDGIDSEDISEDLLDIADNDKIKAVVLRINSPGGSAYGSEQIWKAVSVVKSKKPIVVSMGDYAASGGYYIACNTDRIFAQPTTLTGSIGIFGIFPNIGGLTDKLGIKFDNVKTNKYSDFGATYRPMTTEERVILQRYIEKGYELFTKRCAEGRNMNIDSLKAIAEGRIYSGTDAMRLGLVDEMGGLEEAITFAAKKANISNYTLKYYPSVKSLIEQISDIFSTSVEERIVKSQLGENYLIFRAVQKAQTTTGIRAMMPYEIMVK
ncbi:MAG: signal peptide peptidase SppA [Bacteroidota bacterium]